MATLTSSSSSLRCVPFGFRRGGGGRRSRGLPVPADSHAATVPAAGCGRPLCRAAELVGGGIRGAFFTSLETCSCVEVRTKHDDESFGMPDADPDPEAAAPLINGGRRRRKGGSSSKQQRRGGLAGCCDANSTSTVN
ncbi:unnamed protein product [Urochloa decumbens]|uniref:Uncharacterized protein n=1 Tax=Urochloa decumbens TaxID=240449 RepID=A0ABC8W8Y3_9POAL